MEGKAAEAGNRGADEERKVIRREIREERQRNTARRIRWASKGTKGGGVTKVSRVTCSKEATCRCNGRGCQEILSSKMEIEQGLAAKLTDRSWFMEGTFFMKPRNRRSFGILAEKTAAREVIKGRFISSAGMS